MQITRTITAAGSVLLLAVGLTACVPQASIPNAERESAAVGNAELTTEQEQNVRAELSKYGTDAETEDELIEKLNDGERWDSQNGSEPVSEDVVRVDGLDYSVSRWDDGSLFAVGIASGEGALTAAAEEAPDSKVDAIPADLGPGITRCTPQPSVGTLPYVNCLITFSGAIYGGSFRADFTVDYGSGFPGRIERVAEADYFSVAGVVASDGQSPPVRIVYANATYQQPAMAELTFLYSSTGAVAGSSAAVRLRVSGENARVTSP